MPINTLLPIKIDKNDPSYKAVKELKDALSLAKEKHIRNIALTGPFGSGKSSVLITLMTDCAKEHKYLPISLATLQANEEFFPPNKQQNKASEQVKYPQEPAIDQEKQIENLNRKIEYSILQQLIYREKTQTVPNSRFRKIVHPSKCELFTYPFGFVLTIVCILIAFEPEFAKVDSIYNFFNWGTTWNTIFDFAASGWLLFALFKIAHYIVKSYSNSKLNKLNLKDGEIEVIEDNSIFNRHLDEILYFFQVTDYDVVIIEDLDRFGTSNIFLKLRELNQLINESKIVGRHITFIYAIKDDVFKNEERTKFFDFITTVIPVINPSNSKNKLKEALQQKGCENDDISDDDLAEMAFFIQDMRILTNIANEYKQYRDKLCNNENTPLNKTKLLGMIVYKNYYPQDFALLHRCEGKVYECISSKPKFIELALKSIEESENALTQKEQDYKQEINLNKTDLRRLFLFHLWHQCSARPISFYIDNKDFSLENIALDETLFNKLINSTSITYKHYSGYGNNTSSVNIDLAQIDKKTHYSERIAQIAKGTDYFKKEYKRIQMEKIYVKSLKLKALIKKYRLGETNEFRKLELTPMMNVFLRRGYLDEDYYDYISYFYEGMVTLNDQALLLSMKMEDGKPYTYRIDRIENFVKELRDYMFESDAILNIDLLDYLSTNKIHNEHFEHLMLRLERDNAPLQFLSQYYSKGKQQVKVFKHYIEYVNSWNDIIKWENPEEKDILTEAYLKFCPTLNQEPQEWLNGNFKFLVKHCNNITLNQALKLASSCNFLNLCNGVNELLDYVIEHNSYAISLENMLLISKHLVQKDKTLSANNLNYTRIKATNNKAFISYVEENISAAIQCLKDENKDESSETLMFLLTNSVITPEVKTTYLTGQHNHIADFDGIDDEAISEIAVKSQILHPTWKNVSIYYAIKDGLSEELNEYINHYAKELSTEIYSDVLDKKIELYVALFGSDILTTKNYTTLLKSFNGDFPKPAQLKNVSKERLEILINNGRIPFNQDFLTIINETKALAEYIIYHAKKFVTHLDLAYNLNINNTYEILTSGKFSLDEKYNIIGIIPIDILKNSQQLAAIAIDVFSKKQSVNITHDSLVILLQCANYKVQKIQLITSIIQNGDKNHEHITQFLSAIGGNYLDVCNSEKSAKLPNDTLNTDLLDALVQSEYISSFKEEKNQLIVLHK